MPGADEFRQSPLTRALGRMAERIDHRWGWDTLPRPVGLLVLIGIRSRLRANNLYDTEAIPTTDPAPLPEFSEALRTARSCDGTYNDLDSARMGMAGARFGRNFPLQSTWPEPPSTLLKPDPRLISNRLLARREFVPAPTLNVLAATWLQFMVKDWFSHGHGDPERAAYRRKPAAGDSWPEEELVIPATVADSTRPPGSGEDPPTFQNFNSSWWDGSSIYGSSLQAQKMIREDDRSSGRIKVSETGLVVMPGDPAVDPTLVPGFWTGLAMWGNLFALEHNSVCAALAAAYPTWDGEELFQRARLVVCALTAKIHILQWTPAVIAHPTTRFGAGANWYGMAGKRIWNRFGRISSSEVVSGPLGTRVRHFGVPYAMTEEFAIVYRMHPLIPDEYEIRDHRTGAVTNTYNLREMCGPAGEKLMHDPVLANWYYSFGTSCAGALDLHNFPKFLQEFERPDGKYVDLAAADILRTRELGVPRYNEFRRLLRLAPARTFAELTDDVDLQRELADVYGDVEEIDTIVGMFAERRPKGFGFSDTAFRIFALMAARRLNSDRFLTADFTPRVYSDVGFKWVADNDMTSVLLRHYPELRSVLRGAENPFAPWPPA